jgi:hypothetical protein
MKIGSSLALICFGAILAFAVTATPSFFNLHTAGWVLMLIGVIGLVIPGRTAGWLGRRVLVRRTYPRGRAAPYGASNPGGPTVQQALPSRPTLLDPEDDLIEDAEPRYTEVQETETTGYHSAVAQPQSGAPYPGTPSPRAGSTEVIEDLYEQP